ncbi:MAG: nickel-dependent lactate racemase [Candidatus Latescibacterota bacterium]|nr:MAG: nickel-dependent lactate racemase [Candidatus Latescibacterota bacterium]
MVAEIAYGAGRLPVRLPAGVAADSVDAREPEPLASPERAIAEALRRPIDAPPLADLAKGRSSAVILVPDGTRPIPLPLVLPPILESIERSIPRERIEVLFATGMHRPVGAEEARRLLGPELADTVRWVSHDCEKTRTIGRTGRGTPVSLSETYLGADLRVAVGLVEPHLLAGFSGGRKLVAPGVIGIEAMPILHGPEIIGHRMARVGILDGNPFHEEALAIASAARLDFAVSVTIGRGRRVAGVFAGEFDRSHRAACDVVARDSRVRTRGGRDLVVTSGGGAPLDATFYQSVKGIAGAEPLLRKKGAVLLCASCREGWGSEPFTSLLAETPDLESFLAWAGREGSFRRDQWMVQHLREAMERVDVYLYSDRIDPEEARRFGLRPVSSPEEGIGAALEGGRDPSVAIIPEGPYTWAAPA